MAGGRGAWGCVIESSQKDLCSSALCDYFCHCLPTCERMTENRLARLRLWEGAHTPHGDVKTCFTTSVGLQCHPGIHRLGFHLLLVLVPWNLDHFLSSGEGSSSYPLIPNLSLNAWQGLYQNWTARWKAWLGIRGKEGETERCYYLSEAQRAWNEQLGFWGLCLGRMRMLKVSNTFLWT